MVNDILDEVATIGEIEDAREGTFCYGYIGCKQKGCQNQSLITLKKVENLMI